MKEVYNEYSKYLKEKYGEKIYKLPINLPGTCPNRDGSLSVGGCSYCGDLGTGYEMLDNMMPVQEQIETNKVHIKTKYKANKFIAYFQNYTNTYMELEVFKQYMYQAVGDDIVEIAISTRPDCIGEDYLSFFKKFSIETGINISIELGLQSVNYHTLKIINRGHGLSEFIDSVLRIKKYGFEICVHMILNMPYDNMDDVIEGAKILSALNIDQIKLHSLYICEGSVMSEQFKKGELELLSLDDYKQKVIKFLEYTNENIAIQRIIGRAPKKDAIFVNWGVSWWKIRDDILDEMRKTGSYQGKYAK